MHNLVLFNAMLCAAFAWSAVTKHHHEFNFQPGEYYEYDVEGSHSDQRKRKIRAHTKDVVVAPIKAVRWTVHTAGSAVKKLVSGIEAFLKASHNFGGQEGKLKSALGDFEEQMLVDDSFGSKEHSHSPLDFPHTIWAALKRAFHAADFRMHRNTARGLKTMIYAGHDDA